MSGNRVGGGAGLRIFPLLWLMLLYAGFVYLAVGTISVSQLNSRFGDRAGSVFHLADLIDRLRQGKMQHLEQAERSLGVARQMRDGYLLGLVSLGQQVGLSQSATRAALEDKAHAARLGDLGIAADPQLTRQWDDGVAAYVRENLAMELADEQRSRVLAQIKGGLEMILDEGDSDGKVLGLDAAQVETATSVVTGLRRFGFAWLFTVPQEVLTLFLALSLGALGATLHMTKATLDGDGDVPAAIWYVFRPCQGVLMALAVFILLKAGQLTMAAGDNDTLNPFFVAFVGIVSGLLAQDAYGLIIRAGAKLIPSEEADASRWAFGLHDRMAEAGFSGRDVAAGLGVAADCFDDWLNERQPVPPMDQKRIAAWLRMDARQLFSPDPPVTG